MHKNQQKPKLSFPQAKSMSDTAEVISRQAGSRLSRWLQKHTCRMPRRSLRSGSHCHGRQPGMPSCFEVFQAVRRLLTLHNMRPDARPLLEGAAAHPVRRLHQPPPGKHIPASPDVPALSAPTSAQQLCALAATLCTCSYFHGKLSPFQRWCQTHRVRVIRVSRRAC